MVTTVANPFRVLVTVVIVCTGFPTRAPSIDIMPALGPGPVLLWGLDLLRAILSPTANMS